MSSNKLSVKKHRRRGSGDSMMSTMTVQPDQNEPTFPCQICGRKFVQRALERHEPACHKLHAKKRKTFEAGKQRAQGSDIPLQSVLKVKKELEQNDGVFERPKTQWRERHETFISAIRNAKGVTHALKTGSPLPPPPKAFVPSDYVKCDYCGRNFNRGAAERHIPYCKEKQALIRPKPAPPPQPARRSLVPTQRPPTNGSISGPQPIKPVHRSSVPRSPSYDDGANSAPATRHRSNSRPGMNNSVRSSGYGQGARSSGYGQQPSNRPTMNGRSHSADRKAPPRTAMSEKSNYSGRSNYGMTEPSSQMRKPSPSRSSGIPKPQQQSRGMPSPGQRRRN